MGTKLMKSVHIMLCAWVAALATTSPAFALPTPDALISVANIVPIIIGGLAAAVSGIYLAIQKVLGTKASGLVVGGLFGGFIVIMGALLLFGLNWNENRKQQRINDIAMYLRCDIGAHEAFFQRGKGNEKAKEVWQSIGNFSEIKLKDVAQKLQSQPSAALIATPARYIQYASGIAGVELNKQVMLFSFVREKALIAHLNDVDSKDLYLSDFYRYYKRHPDKYHQDITQLQVFKKFENIYIVRSSGDEGRFVREESGEIRAADSRVKRIDWPVREERWIKDEQRVLFPNMLNLLADDDAAEQLANEEVFLVAAYNSFHRHEFIQIKAYLNKLLAGIDPKRVLIVDMRSEQTDETMARLAKVLDGKPFLVVGMTKYDWVYDGLDVAFEMWERLGHDEQRFQLQGFTTRLPEVSAIRWDEQRSISMSDYLWGPVWRSITWLKDMLSVPTGAAILLFAVLLRLVFFPLGLLEARSRLMRVRVKQVLTDGSQPLWAASQQTLLKHLKVNSRWELLGTLLMLALILPAYTILTSPPNGMYAQGFLWMTNLAAPDVWMSILLSVLIFIKMKLAGLHVSSRLLVLMGLLCAWLLFYLPAGLLLYVLGVLLVTTGQELLAWKHSHERMRRALLS
ncbi:MAG TPA: hypothetical protein EYP39_04840 [Ghiorsea sp.]|nr:hypothetical protein [Ghiorsea sp.]